MLIFKSNVRVVLFIIRQISTKSRLDFRRFLRVRLSSHFSAVGEGKWGEGVGRAG